MPLTERTTEEIAADLAEFLETGPGSEYFKQALIDLVREGRAEYKRLADGEFVFRAIPLTH